MTADTGIMERLKASTEEQHRDAERRQLQQDLVRGRLPVAVYAEWLGQMLALHAALWREIERRRDGAPVLREVVRDEGIHVAHLRADLETLGRDPDAVVALPATRAAIEGIGRTGAGDPIALLGHNYVLEGSMNGNRFIARAVRPGLATEATSYLDPYGDGQRQAWQAYRERMNGARFEPEEADRLVSAAREMFTWIAAMSEDVIREANAA